MMMIYDGDNDDGVDGSDYDGADYMSMTMT